MYQSLFFLVLCVRWPVQPVISGNHCSDHYSDHCWTLFRPPFISATLSTTLPAITLSITLPITVDLSHNFLSGEIPSFLDGVETLRWNNHFAGKGVGWGAIVSKWTVDRRSAMVNMINKRTKTREEWVAAVWAAVRWRWFSMARVVMFETVAVVRWWWWRWVAVVPNGGNGDVYRLSRLQVIL